MPGISKEGYFQIFTEKAYPKVYRFALSLCRNREDAQDVTQDAFVRAFRYFEQWRGTCTFETWVMAIAKNAFIDRRRAAGRCPKMFSLSEVEATEEGDYRSERWLADPTPSPEESSLATTLDPELAAAVQRLPLEQREIFWLLSVEGRPYLEVAQTKRLPIGTVKSRASRAMRRLRHLLAS